MQEPHRIKWLRMQMSSSPHTKVTGYLGELVVMEYLKTTRWFLYQPRRRKVGDLLAVDTETGWQIKIEIKTAKRGKKGKYQACLRKNDKYGQTDVSHADIVLLVCVDAAGGFYPFVIPNRDIGNEQKRLTISSHPMDYGGKYSKYRQRWADIEEAVMDAAVVNSIPF